MLHSFIRIILKRKEPRIDMVHMCKLNPPVRHSEGVNFEMSLNEGVEKFKE